MSVVLGLSILLRLAALGWSLLLVRRLRDARVVLLSLMLALMALRQILALLGYSEEAPVEAVLVGSELPGLLVSLLAFGAVAGLNRMLTEYQEARTELTKTEARYALATEAGRVGVWDWALRTDEIYVDPRLKEMLGYRENEIPNRLEEWSSLIHPEDREQVMTAAEDHLQGKSPIFEVEHRMLHREGHELWYLAQAKAVADDAGEAYRMVGTNTDITTRRLAQQELEALEARYRGLFEDAPAMYVITRDEDGIPVVEDCNRQFLETTGYDRTEVIGRSLEEFYTDASRRELIDHGGFQRALAGGVTGEERQLVRRDGRVVEALMRALPERDDEGSVIGTRATYVDITERKRAEEALRKSEEQYRAVFEAVSEGLVIRRLSDGRLVALNPAMAAMHGYTREELMSMPVNAYLPPASREEFEKVMAAVRRGERIETVGKALRRDGSSFDLEGLFVPFLYRGEPHALGVLRDVTERNRSRQQLFLSRERLRKLAAATDSVREEERRAVAREIHDHLGQALTALKMDVSWLSGRLGDAGSPERERTESMRALIDRTIDSVRDLSARLRPAMLDDLGLNSALEWQVGQFTQRSGVECDLSLAQVETSSDLAIACYRIVQEALTNVARHAEAGRVEISLAVEGRDLVLEIRDDGRGIDEEELWSLDSLGLTSMRERAGRLGGRLEITRHAGGGTRVAARIPL